MTVLEDELDKLDPIGNRIRLTGEQIYDEQIYDDREKASSIRYVHII